MGTTTTEETKRRLRAQAKQVRFEMPHGVPATKRREPSRRLSQNEVAQLARRPHRRGWPA